jgi:phage repressor protein C with HTH and peptisase S24 domain
MRESVPPKDGDGFPQRLREAIGSQTVRAFARRLGFPETAVHEYLSGASEPRVGRLALMARLTRVHPEWLVLGVGSRDAAGFSWDGVTQPLMPLPKDNRRLVFSDDSLFLKLFSARLREAFEGRVARRVAREAGLSQPTLRRYLDGDMEPTRKALAGLCVTLGVRATWLLTGMGVRGIQRPGEPGEVATPNIEALLERMPPEERSALWLRLASGKEREELLGAAGYREWREQGSLGETPAPRLAMGSVWMEKLGLAGRRLFLLVARGDAMAPTLAEGDLALVDAGVDSIPGDGLYALAGEGGNFIRRVQIRPYEPPLVKCDNPAYESSPLTTDGPGRMQVKGRVVMVVKGV